MNPLFYLDGYKVSHREQYPKGTEYVYSNFTPRKARPEAAQDGMVFFGLQAALIKFIDELEKHIEDITLCGEDPPTHIAGEYQAVMQQYLGDFDYPQHIEDFVVYYMENGELPIKVKALPEGSLVPFGVPAMTMVNTNPNFFWFVNYLETYLSSQLWKPCTSATTARRFRKLFDDYAEATGADKSFVDFQGHDFSFRGMSNVEDAMTSGAAHLLFFKGSDTVPAFGFIDDYYPGTDFPLASVPATEHSVMCAGGEDDERATFERLITEVYPKGIVSIVADTWDFFGVLTDIAPSLKDEIMARDGKVVFRPDSGVPNLIVNGNPDSEDEDERKGALQILWEQFGGTTNEKGFKVLDPHVGLIYGDGIDIVMAEKILQGMADNGFASSNIVLGLGSFTYQYATRDTYGTVCKATHVTINGEDKPIFKQPKTGAWKTSHKGLLRVDLVDGKFQVTQDVTREEEEQGELVTVYDKGLVEDKIQGFESIREKALGTLD